MNILRHQPRYLLQCLNKHSLSPFSRSLSLSAWASPCFCRCLLMLNLVLFILPWPFSLGWSAESVTVKIPLPLLWEKPSPLAAPAAPEEAAWAWKYVRTSGVSSFTCKFSDDSMFFTACSGSRTSGGLNSSNYRKILQSWGDTILWNRMFFNWYSLTM